MFRSLALVAVLAVPTTAFAQDTPAIDIVATILGGVTPGATVNFGPAPNSPVSQNGPGVFAVTPKEGDPAIVTVTEFEPCIFDLDFSLGGESVGKVRFDSTQVTDIVYSENGASDGLTNYGIELKGEPGVMSNVMPDGSVTPTTNDSQFQSSVTLDELEASVEAFQAICPAKAE